jgi:amino acid transporter
VFLVYGIGGAVHWGGFPAGPGRDLEAALLSFYVAATAAGDGALLDLALRYPRASREGHVRAIAPYLVGLLVLLAVPVAPFLPQPSLAALSSLGLLLAFGMSVAAGVVLLVKWFRTGREEPGAAGLAAIVAAVVASTVGDLVGETGLLPSDACKLGYAVVPLTLAWAVTGSRPRTPRSGAAAADSTP